MVAAGGDQYPAFEFLARHMMEEVERTPILKEPVGLWFSCLT